MKYLTQIINEKKFLTFLSTVLASCLLVLVFLLGIIPLVSYYYFRTLFLRGKFFLINDKYYKLTLFTLYVYRNDVNFLRLQKLDFGALLDFKSEFWEFIFSKKILVEKEKLLTHQNPEIRKLAKGN